MIIGTTIGSGSQRFDIEGELGSGAMGTVYRATFHKDDRPRTVALKVVALGLLGNEVAMARFDREIAILKQLKHPHIVRLLASGTWRKTPFIAMEYIDGEALDRVLIRRIRLGWEEVVSYMKQLCEALQYAHDKGIIHRDLKPSNLMITRDNVMKLTDFGIAKDTDVTALTGQNSTIGTAAYMSPEQCKGDRNLTNKSDLYSLGIVFYELLTGRKPFTAETPVDMFLKHVNEKPPRIGKQVPDLPGKLEALIQQLMEKDKNDRPIDAAWVARMLAEIEEDVFARKSAGLDAATSKRADRHRNLDGSKPDAEDRDAARTLRGKKKKTKKKEAVPFIQRPAVKASALGLLLGGILVGAFFAFRSPSAENLATAIDSASTPEAKLEAATRYLERYGDKPGEATDRAATVFRDAATRKREDVLNKRFINRIQKPDEADDKDAYDAAWQAMEAEKAGSLRQAAEFWNKAKTRFPDEAKLTFALKDEVLAKARWGWVADRRLADIQKVEQVATATRDKVKNNRRYETPFSTDLTNPESLAVRGTRLEDFGDREKAGRVWDQLITLTEKDPDKRDWHLFACQQRGVIPKTGEDQTKARVERITKRLGEATVAVSEVATDSHRIAIRNQCRDVTDLYEDEKDPEIKALVTQAKGIIASVTKK